jgi:hypothetical protein
MTCKPDAGGCGHDFCWVWYAPHTDRPLCCVAPPHTHMHTHTYAHFAVPFSMAPWANHGAETGGYYRCNVYDPDKTKQVLERLRGEQMEGIGTQRSGLGLALCGAASEKSSTDTAQTPHRHRHSTGTDTAQAQT